MIRWQSMIYSSMRIESNLIMQMLQFLRRGMRENKSGCPGTMKQPASMIWTSILSNWARVRKTSISFYERLMEMYLWINCIYAHKNEDGKWAATLVWDSKQESELRRHKNFIRGDYKGEIHTQYFEDSLTLAVDKILSIADYMNVKINEDFNPEIYYTEDDSLLEQFPLSDEIEIEIEAENKRRNWR